MAISADLSKFKAPGVKMLTVVNNNSPQATPPSGARILVINSRKGLVNTPVLVGDYKREYLSLFDGQSEADFRKGNFGALSAEEMLSVSPIWVLNLRSFDDELDKIGTVKLQCGSNFENDENGQEETIPYRRIHNTQQFWRVDASKLIPNTSTHKSLLNIGNIGTNDLSIIVRKTKTKQRDLTFAQWYANLNRELPPYVLPTDKISDWMVDVIVFDNTFNADSKSNSNYGYCFDVNGFVKKHVVSESSNALVDGIDELKTIPSSGYIRTITGSLIENFVDEGGNSLDIMKLINGAVQELGLVAKLDDELFDVASVWESGNTNKSDGNKKPTPVDFVGHEIFHTDADGYIDDSVFFLEDDLKVLTLDDISYKKTYTLGEFGVSVNTFDNNKKPKFEQLINRHNAFLVGKLDGDTTLVTPKSLDEMVVIGDWDIDKGDKWAGVDANLASVTKVSYIGKAVKVWGVGTVELPIMPFNDEYGGKDWADGVGAEATYRYADSGQVFPKDPQDGYYVYPPTHPLGGEPLAFETKSGLVVHNPSEINKDNYSWQKSNSGSNIRIDWDGLDGGYVAGTEQLIESEYIAEGLFDEADLEAFVEVHATEENIYLVKFDKPLAFSQDPQTTVDSDIAFNSEMHELVMTDGSTFVVYDNALKAYKVENFDKFVDSYQPFSVKAYVPRTEQFLNGTFDRQESVLDVLIEPSMVKSLSNRKLIQWNYIVDGFKTYISPTAKHQLKTVAQKRVTGRAICNMPSVYEFANSVDPYFSNTIGGDFEAKYIATGGNPKLPHNNTYSLPSHEGWHAYFYGAHLTMASGRTFPPAGTVSNNFAMKYLKGKPYVIVAGEEDGRLISVNATGLEHIFSESNDGDGDLDYLYPFGYNALTTTEIGGAIQIFGNHTAYNTVSSPMGAIHTSEVVMYIQEQINSLLKRYVFKYNTANNRLRIKEKADEICQPAMDAGAISQYTNQMDIFNNTENIRNNRIGILDTRLVDGNGMEILVHRTTIDGETNTASFEIL